MEVLTTAAGPSYESFASEKVPLLGECLNHHFAAGRSKEADCSDNLAFFAADARVCQAAMKKVFAALLRQLAFKSLMGPILEEWSYRRAFLLNCAKC